MKLPTPSQPGTTGVPLGGLDFPKGGPADALAVCGRHHRPTGLSTLRSAWRTPSLAASLAHAHPPVPRRPGPTPTQGRRTGRGHRARPQSGLHPPLLTVGLTGGIAAGKSTVDGMLEQLGARVIDADRIVHALLAAGGKAAAPVIAAFGSSVAAGDGGVDRAALGRIVFSDPQARARLEGLVHPLVDKEIDASLDAIRRARGGPIVIVDAALLVETRTDLRFDRLVVVTCSEERQAERLVASRAMTREEALRRIRAQASSAEKAARADYRIDNDGSLDATRVQVANLYRALLDDYKKKLSGSALGPS